MAFKTTGVLSMMAAGLLALSASGAQAACPCMTAASIDDWYAQLGFTPGEAGTKQYCANDPGIVAMNQTHVRFIMVDEDGVELAAANADDGEPKQITERAIEADLQETMGSRAASCRFSTEQGGVLFEKFHTGLTDTEYHSCVAELKASSAWIGLGCQ